MAQPFSGKLFSALYLCVKNCKVLFLDAIKTGVISLCPYAITFKSENELHFWVHKSDVSVYFGVCKPKKRVQKME